MDISNLKRDSAAASEGQWVSDIPDMGNVRLRVRGMSSSKVISLRARKERAVERGDRHRDGSLKPEVAMRIGGEVLHEAILLDWDGLTDGGKPVKYDPKLAAEWCTNPDFQDFANAVAWASMVVDRGYAEVAEAVAGN